jgi:hypothetical protein
MLRIIALCVALLAFVPTGFAQTLEEIDKRDAAVADAWQKTPLTIRRALFISKSDGGFGMYEPRASNVFPASEKLVAYVEPVGYGWKDVGDGWVEFGFVADFLIKAPDGKVLTGKENFATLVKKSRYRNREFDLVLNLSVADAPPGDYVLEYKLRDVATDKSTSFDMPFKISK